jgi:hypothetical protein
VKKTTLKKRWNAAEKTKAKRPQGRRAGMTSRA